MKTRTGLLLLICLNLLAFSAPAQILDFRGAVRNKALNRVNNRIDQTLDKGLNKVEGSITDTLNKKNTSGAGGKTAAESTSQSANEKDPSEGGAIPGVAGNKIKIGEYSSDYDNYGEGESEPVAPNDNLTNKALNRRVEFIKL